MPGLTYLNQQVKEVESSTLGITDEVRMLKDRINVMEQHFHEMGYTSKQIAKSAISGSYTLDAQAETMYGLQLGLCVSTIDPLKQNRVRYYHPAIHRPQIPVKALPFAMPTSAGFPSFDDSGVCWVPPAGTALCLMYQNGNRDSAFYIGSIWNRNRGNPPSWAYPLQEYQDIWAGTRGGYLVGKNDETQVFPPWNTWNYNGYDTDTIADFEQDPEAKKRITYPHIYGIKTPEKAYIRWHDGDRKCNLKWKHTEIMSSRGNFIIMKDDHLHPCGQWANPQCGGDGGDASLCSTSDGDQDSKQEFSCCECGDENCPGGPACKNDPVSGKRCSNKYFKREDECRPYKGSPTPMNPKAWLPQTGIHMQSIGGHHMAFDDSVEKPTGIPKWDLPFDFGCTDRFLGKMYLMSATGHSIVMNDHENEGGGQTCEPSRSERNYIRLQSAAGNRIELNDHTNSCTQIAGEQRGIQMNTTSRHLLYMIDKDNEQASPTRKNGGVPVSKAKNAYCLLRSGYGLHLYMSDFHSQEVAQNQFLQLLAPQIKNERGPHLLHMQVKPTGPGIILHRAGGVMWESSYDHSIETVGEGVKGRRSHKIIDVTGMYILNVDDAYVNVSRLHFFKAEEIIVLGAGMDTPIPKNADDASNIGKSVNDITNGIVNAIAAGQRIPVREKCGPNLAPILCLDPSRGVIVFSDRVIASTSSKAACCPLQLFVGSPSGRSCPPAGGSCSETLEQ
jgi:hypothetical protein